MAEGYKIRLIGLAAIDRRFTKLRDSPKLIGEANREIGNALVSDLIDQAHVAGIHPSALGGGLMNGGIRYEHVQSENGGYLLMPEYGVYLDSMDPHFVTVSQERPELLMWMMQANSGELNRIAQQIAMGERVRYGLRVSPHPFISDGIAHTQQRVLGILRRHTASITE